MANKLTVTGIVGILGLAVATAAFYNSCQAEKARLAAEEARQKHDRLSVKPVLELSTVVEEKNEETIVFEYHLKNIGLGPARIEWLAVEVDGKPTKNWSDAMHLIGLSPNWRNSGETLYLMPGTNLPLGYDELFLKMVVVKDIQRFYQQGSRMRIKICYSSMYGEQWQYEGQASPPHKKGCDATPLTKFWGSSEKTTREKAKLRQLRI